MNENFKWINIFARDLLLLAVVGYVNWAVEFKSWSAAFLAGCLVVLISWHFEDFMDSKKVIKL